jgi:hypothetical protein
MAVNKMLDELPADMTGEAPTLMAHLFQVNPVQMGVAFLCTRVKDADKDDYKKL